jgi:threonine-phosphate decarboxylase
LDFLRQKKSEDLLLTATTPPHGGDVYQMARSLGLKLSDILDFSANINPLGPPPDLPAVVQAALPDLVHYPDRHCVDLRQDLAAYHGLPPDCILAGNGSTELIFLAARALGAKKALIVAPAFSEYQLALEAAGAPISFHFTREEADFTLEGPIDPQGADLVFLANPASPSGALLPIELLLPIVADLDAAGVYTILDEAFIDFVEEASLKGYLARFPRLVILRSFTKFFAIPGLRLGCLLAAPEVVAHLASAQEPWSVSSLAQAVGRACLADTDYIARSRQYVAQERQRLFTGLNQVPGLKAFPGAANYLLVKLTRPGLTAPGLRQALLPQGIAVRDASNFVGLDQRFIRVAVRRGEENERLLKALSQMLAAPSGDAPRRT